MAYSDFLTRTFIAWLYLTVGNWGVVGACFGVNKGIVWKMAHDPDYEPQDATIRSAFGMKHYALTPVCRCGIVHTHGCQPGRAMVKLPPVHERAALLARIYAELKGE